MATSDFTYITFNEHLGDNQGDIDTGFPFMGTRSSVKSFRIDGEPISGYVIVNTQDLDWRTHSILINDRNLPGADLINESSGKITSRLSMDEIPEGFLRNGTNTIQIIMNQNPDVENQDNFLIFDAVVHWKRR